MRGRSWGIPHHTKRPSRLNSTRGAQHLGSTMGAHYRHTTPEMATRVVTAIQERLAVVVGVAEQVVEAQPTRVPRDVF